MKEDAYKSLDFLNMMIELGIVCEECESKPSFPDGWYFAPTPEWAGYPIVCPKCTEKLARKKDE